MKKRVFALLFALSMGLSLAACGQKDPTPTQDRDPAPTSTQNVDNPPGEFQGQDQPAGVARLCKLVGKDQYLLLYDEVSGEAESFYLYEAEKNTFQLLISGKDLWEGAEFHLSVTDDHILYQSGSSRLFSIVGEGKGALSELTKSEEDPYVVSPDGTKYVIRQDGGVSVYDLHQDTLLAQAEGVTGVLAMEWSEDSSRVAMVTNGGGSVAVWDMGTSETFTYDAGQNGHTPEGWVDIRRAYVIGEGPVLLIDYLCEAGVTFVLWDMSANAFLDEVEGMGDATILDISDDRVLYEATRKGEPHTLNCYDCSSKENTVFDRCDGFYTAGCFCEEGNGVLVFRYDTKAKTGELVRIP